MNDMGIPTPIVRRALAAVLLVAAPVLLLLSPVVLIVTAVIDLLVAPRRRPTTRLAAMALHYLVYEWVGIVLAIALWLATGFGLAIDGPWSLRAHDRVQRWWANGIAGGASRWLGLDLAIAGDELPTDGAILIASQHSSFFDALLPTLLLAQRPSDRSRHVLKRELAWDPCLGIFGMRHPNHFVSRRGNATADLAAIEHLAASAGDDTLVIFPEGTFHNEQRAARAAARLAGSDPDRLARLDLHHLLPPRPGGITALLKGRPDSSIVFVAHVGLSSFGSLRAVAENVPFTTPVSIRAWRVSADELPTDSAGQLRVIDEHWQHMDDWLTQEIF